MPEEVLEKEKLKFKSAWKAGFEKGKEIGKKLRNFFRRPRAAKANDRHKRHSSRSSKKRGGKRRGSLDPRVGLGLAAVFITAFIAFLVIAQVEPQVSASIPKNSTLYTSYQTFQGYVGKSFSMWGLAIFVSVLGLVIGAIYAFYRGG